MAGLMNHLSNLLQKTIEKTPILPELSGVSGIGTIERKN